MPALHHFLILDLIKCDDLRASSYIWLERPDCIDCINILVHISCFRLISLLHDFDVALFILNCHRLDSLAYWVIWIGLTFAPRHALRGFLLSLHMQLELCVIRNFYRANWLIIHNFVPILCSPSVLVSRHLELLTSTCLWLSLRQLLKVVYDTLCLRIDVLNLTFIAKGFEIIRT